MEGYKVMVTQVPEGLWLEILALRNFGSKSPPATQLVNLVDRGPMPALLGKTCTSYRYDT